MCGGRGCESSILAPVGYVYSMLLPGLSAGLVLCAIERGCKLLIILARNYSTLVYLSAVHHIDHTTTGDSSTASLHTGQIASI